MLSCDGTRRESRPRVRANRIRPYSSACARSPRSVNRKGEFSANTRAWRLTATAPTLTNSNTASGAHRAVANRLETWSRPPQVIELISVSRTGRCALRATFSAGLIESAIPTVAASLRIRPIVGYVGAVGPEQAEYGY